MIANCSRGRCPDKSNQNTSIRGVYHPHETRDAIRGAPGRVRLVFSTKVRRTEIELVAEYETWKMANSDGKNRRYYIALATGYAKARLPTSRVPIDLLDLLP